MTAQNVPTFPTPTLFFGFASQFLDIARQAAAQSRLLVLRMNRISYMDQTASMRCKMR
jgi:hypothetical protein